MSRKCSTCQHVKRAEIDRRLAAGEPNNQIAKDYGITPSSLYRHRANCLGLASSNAIMKETARGTAAVACLPTRDELGNAYAELKLRIDRIASQAEAAGSVKIALSGLNSIRQTLDSLSRLAGHDQAQVNVAVHADINLDVVFERIIKQFDHEPNIKSRIAQALLNVDHEQAEVDHDEAA
jgi:hypothetical protein